MTTLKLIGILEVISILQSAILLTIAKARCPGSRAILLAIAFVTAERVLVRNCIFTFIFFWIILYQIDICSVENTQYFAIGCFKEYVKCSSTAQCCDGLMCSGGECRRKLGKVSSFKSKDSFLFFPSYCIKLFWIANFLLQAPVKRKEKIARHSKSAANLWNVQPAFVGSQVKLSAIQKNDYTLR